MIAKTTQAAQVATPMIRRAIARDTNGAFAATLSAETARSGETAKAASTAQEPSTERVGLRDRAAAAPEPEAGGRVPIGQRADAEPAGRTPVRTQGSEPSGSTPANEATGGNEPRPNLSTADAAVVTTGTLSEEPGTEGMYVPPDFYHGSSYSPVFDRVDADGNRTPTPRFEGQVIYSDWRGSLPEDFDPNARVVRDPLTFDNTPAHWKKDADGNWVRRETGYGGIPLYDNGKPVFTPDPLLYPEYWKV